MVVVRKNISVEQGEHRLFDEIRYFFYLTNDDETAAADVVFLANDRCQQENLIDQLKHGVGATRMPVDTLLSNWAYMVMAARLDAQGVVRVAVARDRSVGDTLRRGEGRRPAHGIQSVSPRVYAHSGPGRAHESPPRVPLARVESVAGRLPPWVRSLARAPAMLTRGTETRIARPGCTESHVARVEDQPMTTIEQRGQRDIVPTCEVRAAISWRFMSSAEPQTRLFWD
jgi:hypothetical protein